MTYASSERINREIGENPMRSRHCVRERSFINVTGYSIIREGEGLR